MALTLKITSYQSQALGPDSSKDFTGSGGSIGRDPGNTWVLPDPERYISGRHTIITFQSGSYYLTDTSTNGVFVNGSSAQLGNGNSVALHDGDRLSLGDYEIEVRLDDEAVADPLPLPGTFSPPPSTVPEPGAEPDHVSPLDESLQLPEATSEKIPEDWDITSCSIPENPQRPTPPRGGVPVAPRPSPPQTTPPVSTATSHGVEPAAPSPQAASGELSAAFLRGLGIDPAGLNPLESVKAMESYGALFREVVQGMMKVLRARAALKSEFRIPMTTIRPVENNPLKFSPSVDDALNILFSSQGTGYLSPVDSIREGFEDIKDHQMAMVASMQEAFRYMLQRFDPQSFLEQDKGGVLARVPMSRNSRNWGKYCEYFKNITGDAEQCFQTLFGQEFSRAYEEQIQRLMASRRK